MVELRTHPSGVEILGDTSISTRLSEGLKPGGPLKPGAVMRGLLTLEKLYEQFDLRGKPLRAVATAVLRMASNPEVFTGPAGELLGTTVEIITGDEEARLLGRGAVVNLAHVSPPRVALDIGGQSTEVVWQDSDETWHPLSLPMGVVALTERFCAVKKIAPARLKAMREVALEVFSSGISSAVSGPLIGVAGTATTLALLELGTATWDRDRVHGMVVSRETVKKWLGKMARLTPQGRTIHHGIPPGRADVFPAGLVLLGAFMDFADREHVTISANGLRVGVALKLLEDLP